MAERCEIHSFVSDLVKAPRVVTLLDKLLNLPLLIELRNRCGTKLSIKCNFKDVKLNLTFSTW